MTRYSKIMALDKDELYKKAAELFVSWAKEAIGRSDMFTVALSGGSTPRALYSLLAEKYARDINWKKVHVFFGDERCVPPDHPDSNFRMAWETLLSKVGIPFENVHRMKGEKEPGEAAADYIEELYSFFGASGIPVFDLVLLGMGDDGHTASLFPGSDAVNEVFVPAASQFVPKLEAHRLTLTPPVLLKARRVMFLVTGEEKAPALKAVIEGPYQPDKYPAQLLRTADGEVIWLLDKRAAALLNL